MFGILLWQLLLAVLVFFLITRAIWYQQLTTVGKKKWIVAWSIGCGVILAAAEDTFGFQSRFDEPSMGLFFATFCFVLMIDMWKVSSKNN